jgi:hypothetical protein
MWADNDNALDPEQADDLMDDVVRGNMCTCRSCRESPDDLARRARAIQLRRVAREASR